MTLPDGPKAPPLMQMLQWITDPLNYMESNAQRYGDIFTSGSSWNLKPIVFVSNPQAIQKIFLNETKQFSAPATAKRIFRPLLGDLSISRTEDGDHHRRKRQLLMPPFHGEKMAAHGELICDITKQVMNRLKPSETFSAIASLQEVSMRVILEGVFGMREGKRYELIKELLVPWWEALSSPIGSALLFMPLLQLDLGPWSTWGRFCRLREQINQLLLLEIQERRKQFDPTRTDILTTLMSAEDETGQPMTDEELRDEMLTLLTAGQETTATAIAWAMYWIHDQPNVIEKLRNELAALNSSKDPMIIARLPYLTAVCQETLRIYPSIYSSFARMVKSPIDLMGHELPTGTEVMACIYLTHQREDIYPEPKQFKPERFLERKFSPYEYLPFGGGNRRCIGEALALFEMKLVLATILSGYQLELADKQPIRPQIRRVTLTPTGGVKMVMIGQYQPQDLPVMNKAVSLSKK
ncbi:MAG: cytochrome P450 [Nostoc indistinguendum CM1-VF10]|jgi:cytochrome P450|nr:cytochrome P450 [Nostoc indistinguendum CM1-VF10]